MAGKRKWFGFHQNNTHQNLIQIKINGVQLLIINFNEALINNFIDFWYSGGQIKTFGHLQPLLGGKYDRFMGKNRKIETMRDD